MVLFAFYLYLHIVWCELLSLGDISCRNVCLLSNITEPDDTLLVVLSASKDPFKTLTAFSSAELFSYG